MKSHRFSGVKAAVATHPCSHIALEYRDEHSTQPPLLLKGNSLVTPDDSFTFFSYVTKDTGQAERTMLDDSLSHAPFQKCFHCCVLRICFVWLWACSIRIEWFQLHPQICLNSNLDCH